MRGTSPEPAGVDEQGWQEWDAGDYELEQFAEQFAEPEQPEPDEQGINPLDYADAQVGPVEEQLGEQMRRQAWDEAYRSDLSDYVREHAAGMEIRDEGAVARTTEAILAGRQELFRTWLGNGAQRWANTPGRRPGLTEPTSTSTPPSGSRSTGSRYHDLGNDQRVPTGCMPKRCRSDRAQAHQPAPMLRNVPRA